MNEKSKEQENLSSEAESDINLISGQPFENTKEKGVQITMQIAQIKRRLKA